MKSNMLKVGVFGLGLLMIGQLSAQGKKDKRHGAPNPERVMAHLDTSKDGLISQEEAKKAKRGRLSENFETVDGNSDGFLDIQELTTMQEKRREKRSKREIKDR